MRMYVNKPDPITNLSIKKSDLLTILQQQMPELQQSTQYDTYHLLRNIEQKEDKAHEKTIYKWLNMLRYRKEEETHQKSHDKMYQHSAQPITRFFPRLHST